MWIILSRGRPQGLQRFFSGVLPQPETIGVVALDADDAHNYAGVRLPPNWNFRVTPRKFFSAKLNETAAAFPNEPYYAFTMDDCVPKTRKWDTELPRLAGSLGLAWGDDCLPGKRPSSMVIGGELYKALGWFACPSMKHFYTDDVWELIAKELCMAGRCENIKIAHLHYSAGYPHDKTYAERPSSADDQIAFRGWLLNEWPDLRASLSRLLNRQTADSHESPAA